jgi:hypothetical protein
MHSPELQSSVMDESPKTSLMSEFIAGSLKTQSLSSPLQVNWPGPLISSARKSSMSVRMSSSHAA